MFRFKKETPDAADELIEKLFIEMKEYGPASPEFPAMLDYLERLNALKAQEKPKRVSRDTMAMVAGNLVGILIIVAYEQSHVMTSKAFGNIMNPRQGPK